MTKFNLVVDIAKESSKAQTYVLEVADLDEAISIAEYHLNQQYIPTTMAFAYITQNHRADVDILAKVEYVEIKKNKEYKLVSRKLVA